MSVLVVSNVAHGKAYDVVKAITRTTTDPTPSGFPFSANWHIDNKYYSAIVTLSVHDTHIQGEWQAIVIIVDPTQPPDLPDPGEADVAIVVGVDPRQPIPSSPSSIDGDDDDEKDREWDLACLDRGYEYIPARNISRASEALQAHPWPSHPPDPPNPIETGDAFDDDFHPFVSSATTTTQQDDDLRDFIFASKGGQDDLGDLDPVLAKLRSLREHASTLPDHDRRLLAERVALAFAT